MRAWSLVVSIFCFISLTGFSGCSNEDKVPGDDLLGDEAPSSTIVRVIGAALEEDCPNGGVVIGYGIDENFNGTLDTDEVDGTEIICHGEDGADGEQGPQGEQGEQGVPGEAGADAEPCTAVDNGDGTYTITCPDGTSVTLSDGSQGPQGEQGEQGAAGADGEGCSATDNGDGSYTIECPDGTSITVSDGADGQTGEAGENAEPCTASTNDSGDVVISCPDGTSVTVPSGTDGQDGTAGQDASPCSITDNSNGTYTLSCPDGSSVVVSDGATGLTGADGEPCTVADNGDGSMTLTCPDGTSATVSDGTDGLNALIETVTLAPGADCEAGGVTVYVGIDEDRDGVLDAEEIQSSEIICQGVASLLQTREASSAECPFGGVAIEIGKDTGSGAGTANDGILQADEIESVSLVCIPQPPRLTNITLVEPDEQCLGGWEVTSFGDDLNMNGILEDSEIVGTYRYCNQRPYVSTETDMVMLFGASTQLNAVAFDSDGESVEIEWVQTTGTLGIFDDPTSMTPVYTAPSPSRREAVTLELRVTDDRGATSVASVKVMVTPVLWESINSGYSQPVLTDHLGRVWRQSYNRPISGGGVEISENLSDSFGCGVNDDSELVCWGQNGEDCLLYSDSNPVGCGDSVSTNDGSAVLLANVAQVVTSGANGCYIDSSSRLRCWGISGPTIGIGNYNNYERGGYWDETSYRTLHTQQYEAEYVLPLNGWTQVLVGSGIGQNVIREERYYSMRPQGIQFCGLNDANLYCWGDYLGSNGTDLAWGLANNSASTALHTNAQYRGWYGRNLNEPTLIPLNENIAEILAVSPDRLCVLTENDDTKCLGFVADLLNPQSGAIDDGIFNGVADVESPCRNLRFNKSSNGYHCLTDLGQFYYWGSVDSELLGFTIEGSAISGELELHNLNATIVDIVFDSFTDYDLVTSDGRLLTTRPTRFPNFGVLATEYRGFNEITLYEIFPDIELTDL